MQKHCSMVCFSKLCKYNVHLIFLSLQLVFLCLKRPEACCILAQRNPNLDTCHTWLWFLCSDCTFTVQWRDRASARLNNGSKQTTVGIKVYPGWENTHTDQIEIWSSCLVALAGCQALFLILELLVCMWLTVCAFKTLRR